MIMRKKDIYISINTLNQQIKKRVNVNSEVWLMCLGNEEAVSPNL